MSYLHTYFNHTQAVEDAARPLGVKATVDLSDGSLQLVDGQRTESWRAKYLATLDGRTVYLPARGPGVIGFAGWMPYPLRQWRTAVDKIAFKRCAIAAGVDTPAACFDPEQIGGPFLIKHAGGSFGEGIRGPFLAHEPGNPQHRLADGEYYENFVVGHIAKAWCWGDHCVALHLDAPSIVTGDGQSTLRALVQALPNSRQGEHDWALVGRLAEYCGITSLDAVLPKGKEVLVEFRYESRYQVTARDGNPNRMPSLRDHDLGRQFSHAAKVFSGSISPEPALRQSFFTLDAMIDPEGRASFLEMNCNPLVHPDLYAPMLTTYFAGAQRTAVAAPQAAMVAA